MATVNFRLSDFQRAAKDLGAFADQVPFALSRALNDAADITREYLITETYPKSIKERNKTFAKASFSRKYMDRSTKKKLRVAVIDGLDHANFKLHADGGTRRPRGAMLALPNTKSAVFRRTARGKLKLKPKDVPDSFKLNGFIYQRYQINIGGHKINRRRIIFSLKSSARIKKDIPFREDFQRVFAREVGKSFPIRLGQAMESTIASKYK